MSLQRSCDVFPCGNLKPCPVHSRTVDTRSAHARGYDRSWRRRSALFLKRHPRCGDRPAGRAPVMSQCRAEGRVVAAEQVDHVIPHRGDRALFNDSEGNWQALCRACGGRKSASERLGLAHTSHNSLPVNEMEGIALSSRRSAVETPRALSADVVEK